MELADKERKLEELLMSMAPVVVAFSGGVDSSYLAYKAYRTLGAQALAVMAESASVSSHQRRLASQVLKQLGIPFRIVNSRELERALSEKKGYPARSLAESICLCFPGDA